MAQEQTAVRLTQQMVQIDSTNPGNEEEGMKQFLLSFAENLKNDRVAVQTEEVLPGRHNVMLSLSGNEERAELVFICHMDTVPVGNGWNEEPFSGEIKDGRLYGRGACDMKSGFACALSAFQSAVELYREERMPGRTLKLIGTVDEEGNMSGVEKAIQAGWVTKDSLVLDMEPTNGEIQAAHKGRVWFEIAVEGTTAHAAAPWKGADAIAAMAEVISFIRKEFVKLTHHPQMGASTVSFGRISGGNQPYVVSEQCMVTVDMRLVPPYTSKDAEEIVKRAIQYAQAEIRDVYYRDKEVPSTTRHKEKNGSKIKITYHITGDRPYIEMDENSELLIKLLDSCEKTIGHGAETGIFPGYTDTAVIAGKLGNRNCMSYGPGNLELAHKPDESVPIEDILRCEKVLKELINGLSA